MLHTLSIFMFSWLLYSGLEFGREVQWKQISSYWASLLKLYINY